MRVLLLLAVSACFPAPDTDHPLRLDGGERVTSDGAVLADAQLDGAAPVITLRQTNDEDIVSNASVACSNGSYTEENAWYRVFDLATFGVTQTLHITEVSFGVELAVGTQNVIVRIGTYAGAPGTTLDTGSADFAGLVTPINAVFANVPASATGHYVTAPITGDLAPSAKLIVEVLANEHNSQGTTFYVGATNAGQSSPGYLRAPSCGANRPTSTGAIGFPNSHLLIAAVGHY